ncbi:TPA: ribonuclease HII [Candidatus Bathyarchaeota archaeon]|nr:ribonuclease HII [Candidatus Bathyarchaeota archaeon]
MLVSGVDDAGRGAVLGPLVVAGVLVEKERLNLLSELGVRDSKTLTPKKRKQLAHQITKTVNDYCIIKVSPHDIDKVVRSNRRLHKLNRLEAKAMAEVICRLKPDIVYVDASDVLAGRFRLHILEEVPFQVRIVSKHKADKIYPVVSAASILAKVERDKAILEISKKYGDVGSGYAADPRTIKFLEKWIMKYGYFPEFVRKSWKTVKMIRDEIKQKKLMS